jgi:hypothetical protein
LKTVQLYRRTAPASSVIVSTWDSEERRQIAALEQAGAQVILNRRPPCAGPGNINLQIASTRAGIELACETGFQYILKTRTDTRIYATRFLDFLIGLCEAFPISPGYRARGRVLALDLVTRLFIPYHLSDILLFGHREDIHTYWQVPFSTHRAIPDRRTNLGELWTASVPEIYLCQKYCHGAGFDTQMSLAGWWQSLADLFLVVDRHSIGHFWPKHGFAANHNCHGDAHLKVSRLCSHADWLNMTRGVQPGHLDEVRLRQAHPDERAAAAAA